MRGHVGATKTNESEQMIPLDERLVVVLLDLREHSAFKQDEDWMFPSDVYVGRKPLSYPGVWWAFREAAKAAVIPHFGTHTLRHMYRSFLSATGTTLDVQKALMRHADIRTTLSYGQEDRTQMQQIQSRISDRVLQ